MERLNLWTREDWQAFPPEKRLLSLQLPVETMYVTYTLQRQCTEADDCKTAMKNPGCVGAVLKLQQEAIWHDVVYDIPFNFYVGGDGKIFEGRGWKFRPEPIDEPYFIRKNSIIVGFIGPKEGAFYSIRQAKEAMQNVFKLTQYAIVNSYLSQNAKIVFYEKKRKFKPVTQKDNPA